MTPSKKRVVGLLIVFLIVIGTGIVLARTTYANDNSPENRSAGIPLTLKEVVNARPELVWSSIHAARTEYPGLKSGKVISEDESGSILEQTFVVPVLGEANCTFECKDTRPTKFDFKLIKSNFFSALDGGWMLAPGPVEHSTRVELSCYVAGKMFLPKFLLNAILSRKLAKQMNFVKNLAERKEAEVKVAEKRTI